MGDLSSMVEGLSSGINSYLQKNQDQQRTQQNMAVQQNLQTQSQEQLDTFKQGMQGQINPDMANQLFSTISPEFGQAASKAAQSFYQQNGRYLTNDEATKAFDPIMKALNAKTMKEISGDDKDSKQQDTLEKNAMDRLTTVRGDQSLMRSEAQRDAAGSAYDTIAKAQSEGRDLSQVEYTDVLGQLWKARTGSAPTNEIMHELDQKTAKEGINRALTYASGNPNLVGATTTDTLNNVKQFVSATGDKADQQWNAYMGPRTIKPTGLEQSRWDHIMQQHRGITFGEQKQVSDKTYGQQKQDVESKRAALRSKLGL